MRAAGQNPSNTTCRSITVTRLTRIQNSKIQNANPSTEPRRTNSPSASGRSATAAATPSASSCARRSIRATRSAAGELGAYGVNFHDNDLVPIDATPADRDRIVRDFRRALESTGMKVPMATTNLFTDPVFKDGAFTSHDPQVRACGAEDDAGNGSGVELGAHTYVFWGGREGAEVDAARIPSGDQAFPRRHRFSLRVRARSKYELRFALEAKPNEPRGDIYFPPPRRSSASSPRSRIRRWLASTPK